MTQVRAGILVVLAVAFATACSTQLSPGNILTGQVFLQLAVGTLNDSAGTISSLATGTSAPGTYLNAVSSFRNNLGASAFQSPGNGFLHVPAAPAIAVGGLFSYGQGPGANGVTGQPPAYNPPSAVGGYATGFIFTGAPPTPGQYALTTIATVNNQNQQYGASAALPASPRVLGAYPAPGYAPAAGTGGGTLTVTPPAGVFETLIVICSSTCAGFLPPPFPSPNQVATAVTHGGSVALPPGTLAPGSYSAFALGADYPLFESGPPTSTAPTPTLTGAAGTVDLTASPQATITQT